MMLSSLEGQSPTTRRERLSAVVSFFVKERFWGSG
jgi:hypothetical protein